MLVCFALLNNCGYLTAAVGTLLSGLVVSDISAHKVCFYLDALVSTSWDVERVSLSHLIVCISIYPAHIKLGTHLSGSRSVLTL